MCNLLTFSHRICDIFCQFKSCRSHYNNLYHSHRSFSILHSTDNGRCGHRIWCGSENECYQFYTKKSKSCTKPTTTRKSLCSTRSLSLSTRNEICVNSPRFIRTESIFVPTIFRHSTRAAEVRRRKKLFSGSENLFIYEMHVSSIARFITNEISEKRKRKRRARREEKMRCARR